MPSMLALLLMLSPLFPAIRATPASTHQAATPHRAPGTRACRYDDVHVFTYESLTLASLPGPTAERIRSALTPYLGAFAKESGFSQQGIVNVDSLRLLPFQINGVPGGAGLYVIQWDDQISGVNAGLWIVSVDAHSAHNLTGQRSQITSASRSTSGFGVAILSHDHDPYPELLFASKGANNGNGAEAEEQCQRKIGVSYADVPCPAHCHQSLNRTRNPDN